MTYHDKDSNWFHAHYSPSIRYSVGWRHEYFRKESVHADYAQLNILLKRWNNPASQANLYLKSGAGIAYKSDKADVSGFSGLAADWEDRRYFVSYENRFVYAGEFDKFAKHEARIGIAPYIGGHGDLHTWLMLQANYSPGEKDDFSLTPLVRLFKGPTLIEVGYNFDGGIMFNATHTF